MKRMLPLALMCVTATVAAAAEMTVTFDEKTQRVEFAEGKTPILRYNYGTVPVPKGVGGKYAVARSGYIHPLYGPNGETLTTDYSPDHPHHRGLYWAWPEVAWKGETLDLHALQGVFSRPVRIVKSKVYGAEARLVVENRWMWHDKTPIVTETVTIRAHAATKAGRHIDLEFRFVALVEGVTVHRRGQKAYGGFNLRFSAREKQTIVSRDGWGELAGIPPGGKGPVGVGILQNQGNPRYPGDWVSYPNLNWLQPTFPKVGEKFPLSATKPLALRFRLWVHAGVATEAELRKQWGAYNVDAVLTAVPVSQGLPEPFAGVAGYKVGESRRALIAVQNLVKIMPPQHRARLEQMLLDTVGAPGATADGKRFICMQLQIVGSDAAVPALGKLLADPELAHHACIALGSMPPGKADAALRAALGSAKEPTKTGIINLLGERRDQHAVVVLAPIARAKQPAAIAALGKIGGVEASTVLAELPLQLAADARLACAGTLVAEGKTADALSTYQQLSSEKAPTRIRVAALTARVALEKEKALPTVLTWLRGDDARLRATAAGLAARVPGAAATKALCEALPDLPADGQVVVLHALASRGDRGAAPAVATVLGSDVEAVRLASAQALGALGGAGDVHALASASAISGKTAGAVDAALVRLQGDGVDAALGKLLAGEKAPVRLTAIRALIAREGAGVVNTLLTVAGDGDASIRREAFRGLTALAGADQVPELIRLLLAAPANSRSGAERALVSACRRGAGIDAVLATTDPKGLLLPVLGRLGGEKAMAVVRKAAAAGDDAMATAGIRALGMWPDATAAPELLKLAAESKHRTLALRGYFQVVGAADLPPAQKMKRYADAVGVAKKQDEKRMVIAGLAAVPGADALKLVAAYLKDDAVKAEAALAVARMGLAVSGGQARKTLTEAAPLIQDAALRKKVEAHIASMPRLDATNFAQGRPATGSVKHQGPSTPAKAVDGVATLGSFWSGENTPSWLQVDLEQERQIGHVHLVFYWGGGRYYQYKVDLSLDGETWKTAVDGSKNTTPSTPRGFGHAIEPQTARYVRVHILKNSANPGAHIVELRVTEPEKKK
ncbi:PmoA family protein [bacterium]|nr:PmoA family protein [bacterium]